MRCHKFTLAKTFSLNLGVRQYLNDFDPISEKHNYLFKASKTIKNYILAVFNFVIFVNWYPYKFL